VGDDGLHSVRVRSLDDGLGGSLGGDLYGADLVTDSGQRIWQKGDEVRLDGGGDVRVLGDGADGVQRTLAGKSILLVCKLFPQKLDDPMSVSPVVLPCGNFCNFCGFDSLCGSISLLNITVDEGGEVG
jgi:hypothetical protein